MSVLELRFISCLSSQNHSRGGESAVPRAAGHAAGEDLPQAGLSEEEGKPRPLLAALGVASSSPLSPSLAGSR